MNPVTDPIRSAPPYVAGAPSRNGRPRPAHHRVVIVGAGFTGLAMGIELKRARIEDFVILERRDDVGGVWRDNDYPGVAVDTPSKIYNLTRALNPDWSDLFAPGRELHAYSRKVAEDFGLAPHLRFGQDVLEARWDEQQAHWLLTTATSRFTASVLVSAAGLVADPLIPDIPGLAAFPGTVFHSSQWDHTHDLGGERVAVVGTGASAIQFVPQIQPQVGELHVLQRTPTWITPKPKMPIDERTKRRLRRVPGLMRAERIAMYWKLEYNSFGRISRRVRNKHAAAARAHLEAQVHDPELRAKLTPDFEFLCKRPLISSDYYPALQQPNAHLHTGGLVEVRGRTVVAGDGTEAEVDTIILNTGFEIGRTTPIARRIHGRDGQSLQEHWGRLAHAYLGIANPGFPNFFMMQGPNATSGVSSALVFGEAQARYIASAVRSMQRQDVRTVEVRPEVEVAYSRRVRRLSKKTVYEVGGCNSYYLNDDGLNVVMWPGYTFAYQLRTRRFDPSAYEVRRRTGATEPVTAHTPGAEAVA
jgi:cation diffusion facilitator CzcD-associated flavoprotein CzcO